MAAPASHYVQVPIATLRREPALASECTSESLYGECLAELEQHDGWLKVRCLIDGYEGYIDKNTLCNIDKDFTPTHWVQTRSTLLFTEPSIKSRVLQRLPFQSRLTLSDSDINDGPFMRTATGHHVWRAHLLRIDQHHPSDPLSLAHSHFTGAPYVWGGRSPEGLDCSGLIQTLAAAKGLSIPRDSHEQEQFIAKQIEPSDAQATDLVYWPGHVGILQSSTTLLHATANCLGFTVEPLAHVVERAGEISSIRRLFA